MLFKTVHHRDTEAQRQNFWSRHFNSKGSKNSKVEARKRQSTQDSDGLLLHRFESFEIFELIVFLCVSVPPW